MALLAMAPVVSADNVADGDSTSLGGKVPIALYQPVSLQSTRAIPPVGVLLLIPGYNGSGEAMLKKKGPAHDAFLSKLPSEMQSARQSIKPFLVIGKPDDQGRQRGEIEVTENFAPRRKDAKEMNQYFPLLASLRLCAR